MKRKIGIILEFIGTLLIGITFVALGLTAIAILNIQPHLDGDHTLGTIVNIGCGIPLTATVLMAIGKCLK